MIEIKVAILDDEVKDLERMKNYLENVSTNQLSYHCDLYSDVNDEFYDNYDLYVLDIELPCINGLDIGKEIRRINPNAVLIINSKRNDLVFESFKFGVFFFVRKEYFEMDMEYALLRLKEHFISIKKYYIYHSKNQVMNILYSSILYIEKVKNGVEIHLENEVYYENKTLKQILNEIQDSSFIQCHQSYYVNLNHVNRLDENDFIINKERIQISRRFYTKVKQQYIQFLNRKL